jgi:PAS domain S-box-containing protein
VENVTERKETEEALRDSERLFRSLFASSPDIVALTDLNGIVQDINYVSEGYDKSDVIGTDFAADLDSSQIDDFRSAIDEALQSGDQAAYEVTLTSPTGITTHWYNRVSPLIVGGTAVGLIINCTDITKRREAEEALHQSEQKFAKAFRSSPQGVLVSRLSDGRLIEVNQAVEQVTGYGREELIGRTSLELGLVLREDRESTAAVLAEQGSFGNREARFFTKSGEERIALFSGELIEIGGETHIIQIVHDITEAKRTENALRVSEHRYRTLLDNVKLVAVGLDAQGRLSYANPYFLELTGYSAHEALGSDWFSTFLPEESRPVVGAVFREILAEGMHPHVENPILTRSGEQRLISWNNTLLLDADANPVGTISIGEDITERRRAEEELRRSLKETAHNQRTLLALAKAAQQVQRAQTPEHVYQSIGDEITRLGHQAMVLSLSADGQRLTVSHITIQRTLLNALEKLSGVIAEGFQIALSQTPILRGLLSDGGAHFHESTADFMATSLPDDVRHMSKRIGEMLGLGKLIAAPLRVGEQPLGLLVVTGDQVSQSDVPAVTAFANQAAIALDSARLLEEVTKRGDELQALSDRLVRAQEEERQRIARGLQDELGQALKGLKLNLLTIERRLPLSGASTTKRTLRQTAELADHVLAQVQEMARGLRPTMLDTLGLIASLRWHVRRFGERTGIAARLEAPELKGRLAAEAETLIYRTVEQSLATIARHGAATRVTVDVRETENGVQVRIEDDGTELDLDPDMSDTSGDGDGGIASLRQMAGALGGSLGTDTTTGSETLITLSLPLATE